VHHLDSQMQRWSTRLRDDLGIAPPASNQLAGTIAAEVAALTETQKQCLVDASPVSPQDRLDELVAFQAWMEFASTVQRNPAVTHAQVITQNYVCFVYLGDGWFRALRREMPSGSATKKCCKFLTDNRVRAFRNAFAHANWRYKPDFAGLEFWARKGANHDEPMTRFEVTQNELDFWQAVARCTAYASYLTVCGAA